MPEIGFQNIGNDISNGAQGLGQDIKSGINYITNDTVNTTDNNTSDMGTTTGDYSSTRTSASTFTDTDSSTMWIIFGVLTVAIVGFVWYYATQTQNHNNRDHY